MARPYGRRAAEELVRSIAKDHGYLGERVYAKMDPETRKEVQEAMLAKDKMIGSSVVLLARELYSKDVRFIFELLQNADDNHYERALKAKQEPSVAFQLYKDKMVVECNEDGFNEVNLRAICNIGKSSKTGGHGYIGEKGIGFKSVFKVAWKVLIQSGDYSFTFTHRPNDIGMGMISPEWEDASGVDGVPDTGRTRITLYLHQDSEAATRHQGILQQLNDLDNRMLLFLKKLRRVDVHIYNNAHEKVSSTVLSIQLDVAKHRAILKNHKTHQNSSPETTQTYCHVTKHTATGLPRSTNRTYTAAEEAAQSYAKAEVILAFPLSSDDVPIVEAQHVFAFLPIRRFGFKFLIQTDFVTNANREDIVSSSSRNLALLDGIAEAFIKAVREMYGHNTLRYQWMRYLSEMKTYPWDDFWKRLVNKITTKIEQSGIVEPRSQGAPRLTRDLRLISTMHNDIHGDPLFRDLTGASETYISTKYLSDDIWMLREYGLQILSQGMFIDRVKYDLSLSSPRIKDPDRLATWYTRTAIALNYSWNMSWRDEISRTKRLRILPLADGRWVAANDGPVYLPTLESGITIPGNIGLQILASSACVNSERVELFKNLGARHAAAEHIRAKIIEKHARGENRNLEASRANLVFLYQTCTHRPEDFNQYIRFRLYDTESKLVCPPHAKEGFYFPSDDPFSPWQLSLQNKNDLGHDPLLRFLSYINPAYLDNAPSDSGNLSWRNWLEALGVRSRPKLVDDSNGCLTKLCTYIAENMPESFLGFLQYAWESEKSAVFDTVAIDELSDIQVRCNSEGSVLDWRLDGTYLPLPSLLEKASDLMEGEVFPFLWLGGSFIGDGDFGPWGFLTRDLGVGFQDDAEFYTDMLYHIQLLSDDQTQNVERPERVIEIYCRIYSRIGESKDRTTLEESVRHRVQWHKMIYIPGNEDDEAAWVSPSDCLLGAPGSLRHKWPVMERYKAAFPRADLTLVVQFFQNTLGIASYSWEDTVREIRHLKDKEWSDFDLINEQYESLNKARRQWVATGINAKTLRQDFENDSLIFVQNEANQYRWVQPSNCLWSSATEIQDRTNLNTYYDDNLEHFFVDILGVPRLDINMVYDELLRVDPSRTSVKQAKDLLWQVNALLAEGEKPTGTLEKLLSTPILPVRYANGDVKLCSGENEFAIIDRQPLEELFRGKVKFLDYSLSEVHKLEPFLEWAELGGRFLSKLTKEISVVEGGSAVPVSDPIRKIARTAQALTRVAVHLRSSQAHDIQGFYDLLHNAKTLATGGISSEFTIHQDGAKISVEKTKSEVLIQENATGLTIYVPNDEDSLEVCFSSSLPKQLVIWMVTNPATQIRESSVDSSVVAVVTGILATRSPAAITRILDDNGIIDVNIPNLGPEAGANIRSGPEASTPRVTRTPSRPAFSSERLIQPPSTPLSASGIFTSSGITTPGSSFSSSSSSSTPHRHDSYTPRSSALDLAPSAPLVPATPSPSAGPYRRLLAHVLRAARATPALPGPNASSSVVGHLPDAERDGPLFAPVGGWAATDHEKRLVGAAGELFAFELLRTALRVNLSGGGGGGGSELSRDVWQTTIRGHVAAALDEYADMEAWPREERADIVLDGEKEREATSALVGLLVRAGYLDGGDWAGHAVPPTCYIEVKATMGPCGTPFFMSDAQYRKMRDLTTDKSIYMIIRVFNMGNRLISARIYMDPARMEQEGRLKFTADRWTVTPGQGLLV